MREQPASATCYGQRGDTNPPPASYVALGSQDRYYVRFANGRCECVGPEGLHEQLQRFDRVPGKEIRSLAFGVAWDSWFVVYADGTAAVGGAMPAGLTNLLKSTSDTCRGLERVALGPCGQWYLADLDGEAWWEGLDVEGYCLARAHADRVTSMVFGSDHALWLRYQ